jgi:hypothetical protein
MLYWALTFLVVALLAALFGFTGIAVVAAAHETGTKAHKDSAMGGGYGQIGRSSHFEDEQRQPVAPVRYPLAHRASRNHSSSTGGNIRRRGSSPAWMRTSTIDAPVE